MTRALAMICALLVPACYAEWDLPRCSVPADCPVGFTRCYDGYCLAEPLAGVDKAPFSPARTADVFACGGDELAGFAVRAPAPVGSNLHPGVAVDGETLYVVSSAGTLFAIDAATRSELWRVTVPDGAGCPMVLSDGRVVVTHGEGVSWVAEPPAPAVKWGGADGGMSGCLALGPGQTVYGSTAAGSVVALRDGAKVEPFAWPDEVGAPSGSPTWVAQIGRLVVPVEGALAIVAATGALEGKALLGGEAITEVLALGDRLVVGVSLGDGDYAVKSFTAPWTKPPTEAAVPEPVGLVALDLNTVIVATASGSVERVTFASAEPAEWPISTGGKPGSGMAVTVGGHILVADSAAGTLLVLTPEGAGDLSIYLNQEGSPGFLGDAALSVLPGHIALATSLGGLFVIDAPCLQGLSTTSPWPKQRRNLAATAGVDP